jgi:hypothetical protein
MKLIYFSEQTLPKQRINSAAPRVTFGKTGVISFNHAVQTLMGISGGW